MRNAFDVLALLSGAPVGNDAPEFFGTIPDLFNQNLDLAVVQYGYETPIFNIL